MKPLHSKIIGTGIPFLILHGYLGMGDNWKTLANAFSETGFEVHLIDQRNHGRSFHSEVFNYSLMVEDLKNYIAIHNLKNIVLLGHSMGGKTAMLFATTYPEYIDKLIIADISPKKYPAHHNAILKALNSVDFSVCNSRKLVEEQLKKYIPEKGIRQFLAKSLYWKEKGMLDFRFNLQALTKNYEEVIVGLSAQNTFDGNVLFLRGEKSQYITKMDIPLIKNHFPNSSVQTIANAGHWLHAENPKAFYETVVDFLVDTK